ncbi:unnamed protein product [Chrysoparadoxa australica]
MQAARLFGRSLSGALGRPVRRHFFAGLSQSRDFSSTGRRSEIYYDSPPIEVGKEAPTFSCPAVINGEIDKVDLANDFEGQWKVLLFFPKAFTFVCPTEIIAFSDRHLEFKSLNTQVMAISTDTEEALLAWNKMKRKAGGLGECPMNIPLIADVTKDVSCDYGVLIQDIGIAHRGLFIISPAGIVEQITVTGLSVGRSVDETIRLIQAYQFVAEHGEVCPANWKPGEKTMVADPVESMEYFESVAAGEGDDDDDDDDILEAGEHMTVINSEEEYEAFIKHPKAVVDFVAPWCGKCRQMMPFANKLSEEFTDIKFAKLDTEQLPELASKLRVKSLPVFRSFTNGKQMRGDVTGYKKKKLREVVEELSQA